MAGDAAEFESGGFVRWQSTTSSRSTGSPGESLDAQHKGAIDLDSFSWGETNSASASAGAGGGGGKVLMHDLHVTMRTSKASPLLFLACASGQHFTKAVLTARKAGRNQAEFLVFRLTDVIVTSYLIGGQDEVTPSDQASLGFGKIQIEYRPQKPDGSLAAAVKAGWDVKANKKI